MAAILNALFGTYPDPSSETTVEGNSGTTTERLHTSAVADDVQVQSVISSETQANAKLTNKLNINDLLSQLNTTHSQVDAYSRARTTAINEQVNTGILFSFLYVHYFYFNRYKNQLLMFSLEHNVNKKNY